MRFSKAEPVVVASNSAEANRFTQRVRRKCRREHEPLVADAVETVCRVGTQRDRDVGRQRPRRRRPNQHARARRGSRLAFGSHLTVTEGGGDGLRLRLVCGEADVDGGGDFGFVFDFGFGEGGFVVDAPQRRAQAFVELLLFGKIRERVYDRRLEVGFDRLIRTIEVAEDAHALARRALTSNPIERPLRAFCAQLERIDRVKVFDAQMLERFEFDRQPVHIPAGREVRELAVEQRDLHEHVLEHHVQKVPHVQLAVGIRRSVVQNPRPVRAILCQTFFIDAVFAPPRDPVRLALGQLGLHRERGFW